MILRIPAQVEECFYETIHGNQPVSGTFQVTEGGFLEIDCTIKDVDGNIVYKKDRETEGHFSFVGQREGLYSFCFGNKVSTLTSKTVVLRIHHGHYTVPNQNDKSVMPKPDDFKNMEEDLQKLKDICDHIDLEYRYLATRDHRHFQTAESTHQRTFWFELLECGFVVGTAVFQLFYLKRFFEVKSIV